MFPRSSSLLLLPLLGLPLAGCSVLDKTKAEVVDAGHDAAVALVILEAGAPPPLPVIPSNVNQVARFPDEVSANETEAKIADPAVSARNSVPGGALVATLRLGTPVTQIAKHESFILCEFADPKNGANHLEGWLAEQAFVAGPTIPGKAACPHGKTLLIADEQEFCGTTCKSDADCKDPGLACVGKANLVAKGKAGDETSTCTLRSTPALPPAPGPVFPPAPGPAPFGVGRGGDGGVLFRFPVRR
jgi:hypothetical protein